MAKYIYEYIVLSLPLIKVYDCENDDPLPCDEELLERLEVEDTEDKKEWTRTRVHNK